MDQPDGAQKQSSYICNPHPVPAALQKLPFRSFPSVPGQPWQTLKAPRRVPSDAASPSRVIPVAPGSLGTAVLLPSVLASSRARNLAPCLPPDLCRCDGRRPTCSTCTQLGFECQYDAPDSTTNIIVRKDYVSDLELRLKKVEHVLQRHDDLLIGHLSGCETGQERQHGRRAVSFAEDVPSADTDGFQIEASVLGDGVDTESESEARTDGLAITFVDERAASYFGESSNIGFVRYLLGSVSSIWGVKKPEQPPLSNGNNGVKHGAVLSSEHSPLGALPTTPQSLSTSSRLPSPTDMETMINRYFNTMGLLFSFLHEATFRETFSAFKASGFNKVRQTWLGELNLIFAIASNINRKAGKTSKDCFQESLVYYRRAMSLCGASCLRTVSLDIVQFLLLQALYLQGTPQAGEAWSVHGLLVRSAIALGLHNDKVGRQLDEVVQEMRVRTWHTIYCLDTVLSATFGRPSAIPPAHMTVRLPQPWCPAGQPKNHAQAQAAQTATQLLSISVQLYQIMGQSIESQYNGNIGIDQNEDEVAMLQAASALRQKLRRWAETLPPEFALLAGNSPELKHSSRVNKLRAITTIRYHSVSIFVHRPLLCVTLRYISKINGKPNVELPYTTQLAMAEAYECITSAEATIDMAATVFGDGPKEDSNLGVWFFTLYYGKYLDLTQTKYDVLILRSIHSSADGVWRNALRQT